MNEPALDISPLDSVIDSVFRKNHLSHCLIRGDATQLSCLSKSSVDLIITSPPYNVGKAYSGSESDDLLTYDEYLKFSKCWLKNCFNWSKSTGRLCVNVPLDKNKDGKNPVTADITRIAMNIGWKYHATIIWNEGNISRRTAWGSWKSASAPHVIAPVETILIFYKDKWKRERQGQSDITADEFKNWVLGLWEFGGENSKRIGHEAPFPRELPKRCIKLFSFVGDIVLDPFMGSGTTMIEAIENERIAVGIEKELKYCNLIQKRVRNKCGLQLKESSPVRRVKSIKRCWTI